MHDPCELLPWVMVAYVTVIKASALLSNLIYPSDPSTRTGWPHMMPSAIKNGQELSVATVTENSTKGMARLSPHVAARLADASVNAITIQRTRSTSMLPGKQSQPAHEVVEVDELCTYPEGRCTHCMQKDLLMGTSYHLRGCVLHAPGPIWSY